MKRKLLLASLFLPGALMAQNALTVNPDIDKPEVYKERAVAVDPQVVNIPSLGMNTNYKYKKVLSYNFVQIGSTYYDLQSNGSTGNRVLLHSNGNVSAVWTTTENTAAGFPTRGSGYNHNSGSGFGPSVSTRVESVRTGWPSLGLLGDGSEYIVAHFAESNGGFFISKNGSVGSNTWTTGRNVLAGSSARSIWARTAANGNTIHLISSYSDTLSTGGNISVNGVIRPTTYSRSLDGGLTWTDSLIVLPGYDSTRRLSGSADEYAITAKGNTVAIVMGGLGDDVTLWKSIDNGDNWSVTIVDEFPYAPFTKKLTVDTPFTNDGTVDVIIDNNDQVHVFWGLGRVFDNDTSDESFFFFPAQAGIVHWTESNPNNAAVVATIPDEDLSGTLDIEPGTFAALQDGNIPQNVAGVARTGNTSLVTMPAASVDANGNIYLVYSAPRERDLNIDQLNYRDVFVVVSTDGGATWSEPQNLTQAQGMEDAFPTVAKTADNFLHIVWQQDEIPGTNLQNNSANLNNHPVVENKILYAAVPVQEILNNSIGTGVGVSTENVSAELFVVGQNYPNPFQGESKVIIYLTKESDVKVSITNILGQTLRTETQNGLGAGNHELTLDANGLTPGVYFYTIEAAGQTVTKRMSVR